MIIIGVSCRISTVQTANSEENYPFGQWILIQLMVKYIRKKHNGR